MRLRSFIHCLAILLFASRAAAGPPYATDDPEPVEHHHWELYLASQSFRDKDGWTGTAPHFEVNYGVLPDTQLHLIAPAAYTAPRNGAATYGYGDTELGVKYRFVHEQKWVPMIGTFPFLEVPSGNVDRGLGNGSTQTFLPVWLQKRFGSTQTYGGCGVWIDLGDRSRHYWYFGWQVQQEIRKGLNIGGEIFYVTPRQHGGRGESRFNLGAVLDLSENHHLLLSAGRALDGENLFQGYAAYQLTFGPEGE
jgi:hypothetical protein